MAEPEPFDMADPLGWVERYRADPDNQTRLLKALADSTDPWRWYCRLCGASGIDDSRIVVHDQIAEHFRTSCTNSPREQRYGECFVRLMHVW